ncbi:hypothetical protein RBB77_22680 [Tunturibacter psychrotolerans]|uniref:hypothetical protein n=1 Tax=Tunturiibacter psychrotolerans TaxID=3069686 RepID=UPI00334260A0
MGISSKALAWCWTSLLCLALVSCGSGSHVATGDGAGITPAAEFSLSAMPSSLTLMASGAGQQLSVSAAGSNSFTGTVLVAITGPAGVTAQPATLTLTPGAAQSVTLSAGANAVAGSGTVTLTGTSGTLSHSIAVSETVVAAAGDFSLTAAPSALTVVAGGAGQTLSVNAVSTNSFAGAVSVAITGLPAGVTAQPATLTLTPGTPQSVSLSANANAVAGSSMLTLTGRSGALSHSATIALTVSVSQPDYALTLSPASLNVVAGTTSAPVSVTVSGVNSFSGAVSVAITGLPNGVAANPLTLTLTPGVAQSTTLTVPLLTAAGSSTVSFTGTAGSLVHSSLLALTVQAAPMINAPDVTTYHFDVARDGLNAKETILTPANVNSTQFGKIGFFAVDSKVDGEPLYLANVPIGNQYHNVLYVVTEHDSVYAFDADSGAQIWKTSIIGSGETTSGDHGCNQISPEIGITSTPVIDPGLGPNGTLFTVGMTEDSSGNYHQRLHALDVVTGAEVSGSPTEVVASYPGAGDNSKNGSVVFDPAQYAERAALLLLNGTIYTGWTSHCDYRPYTGWIIGYSETSLQQTQVLNVTPNGNEGSIWMTGDGLGADSSGNIYFLDANGTFDTTFDAHGFPANGDYGNGMIKLSTSGKLAVADYFQTYDTNAESAADADLGSGGELILPDQADSNGVVHRLIVGAGKDGNIYLADRDNMGKYNPASNPQDNNIYQEVRGQLGGQVYSTPAYFNGTLYYGAVSDSLKAFPLTNATLTTYSSQSSTTFPYPGTTPGISANGTQNGIVWALESSTGSAGVLHAFDATNLARELYNSGQAANGRDSFGTGNKFITPMIVNGKVYVGTQTGVAVFGLLP